MTAVYRNNNDDVDGFRPVKEGQLDGGLTLTYATFYQTIQQLHQQQRHTSSSSLVLPNPSRRTSPAVCYVIVSATSAVWTVLTVITATLVGLALLTPRWLVIEVTPIQFQSGTSPAVDNQNFATPASSKASMMDYADALGNVSMRQRRHRENHRTVKRRMISVMLHVESMSRTRASRTTSIGIFNECYASIGDSSSGFDLDRSSSSKLPSASAKDDDWETINFIARLLMLQSANSNCDTYFTGFDMPDELFPDAWKSALILLSAAATLLAFTCVTALASVCVQSLFGKSIFTVSGLLQSIAALLLVIGQLLYTVGWTSRRVREICGEHAGPFVSDRCAMGGSFYCCMAATLLVFVCALLSIRAENATSTDDVEKKILEGSCVVCVP